MADLDVLWEPLDIGPVTAPNRIFVSAHQTGYAGEAGGLVSDRYLAYLGERVRGGAGLVMTEVAPVFPTLPRRLTAWRDEIVPAWRRLADTVHDAGSLVFAQLWHPGAHEMGQADLDDWHATRAPSELQSVFTGRVSRALREDEIAELVSLYADAARRARDGGLDGVEIHGGHGYLPCQFLSPMSNHRTDRYGGSLENRCRFLVEIAAAIRDAVGRDIAVGTRLSYDEYVGSAGLTPEESTAIVAHLAESGLFDFYDVSGGNYHSMDRMIPTRTSGLEGHMAVNARMARGASAGTPVFVASAVRTVEQAAEIVAAGASDMVAMTRAHLADPQLVSKARSGRAGEIRRCVGANQSCLRRLYQHGNITCTVNPAAGRESRWGAGALPAAPAAKRVLVVGGGPAGMKAAETAAQRGHAVTLWEAGDQLGGLLRHAGRLPGKESWHELVADLGRSLERLGVEVVTGRRASTEEIAASGADEVVVATGSRFVARGRSAAEPERDGVPGADLPHVLDPVGALEGLEGLAGTVVVFDDAGDHVAGSLALLLAESGRSVELATRHLFLGAGGALHQSHDHEWLMRRLAAAGVRPSAQTTLVSIGAESVVLADAWSRDERTVSAGSVVLSVVRTSERTLADELRAAGVRVAEAGDCVSPREVDDAMYEGMVAGASV
jgi:2,4-dienoyl-CoA reductase-like NADH-dependent reductase (Old Yellow Enzyme family)/thioredoxin reductase